MEIVVHPLKPIVAPDARVLLLGTMPSPKSREIGFYYGHPQNRFWRVMTAVLGEPVLPPVPSEKAAMLLRHQIALWDVLHSCRITGASDASIREPVPNPIAEMLYNTEIRSVFTTGKRAHSLYEKLIYPATGLHAVPLPSTSPANCRMSMQALIAAYRCILDGMDV